MDCGTDQSLIACTFSGSGCNPSVDATKPRNTALWYKKDHFFKFTLGFCCEQPPTLDSNDSIALLQFDDISIYHQNKQLKMIPRKGHIPHESVWGIREVTRH